MALGLNLILLNPSSCTSGSSKSLLGLADWKLANMAVPSLLGAPVICNVRKAAGGWTRPQTQARPQKALTSLGYSVLGETGSVHTTHCRPFNFGNAWEGPPLPRTSSAGCMCYCTALGFLVLSALKSAKRLGVHGPRLMIGTGLRKQCMAICSATDISVSAVMQHII